MIPLRDVNPSRTVPVVTYLLIGLNAAAFLFELSLGEDLPRLVGELGVVPARVGAALGSPGSDPGAFTAFITSMFLHGGWLHLIGNMVFLHVFGDNIEDRFGHGRFVLFYLVAGAAAAAAQVLAEPSSEVPMVGASGAIAGVLGAYVILYPRARVLTLVPIFVFFQLIELPAVVFLGLWFLMQVGSGLLSLGVGADAGGVAWWAHVGGFVAGALMLPAMKRAPP
jgi:membrane associated rhomboid family serine protease